MSAPAVPGCQLIRSSVVLNLRIGCGGVAVSDLRYGRVRPAISRATYRRPRGATHSGLHGPRTRLCSALRCRRLPEGSTPPVRDPFLAGWPTSADTEPATGAPVFIDDWR